MGLFDFLKKKPQRTRQVSLGQLPAFLDQQEERIAEETGFLAFQQELVGHRAHIDDALHKLANAELLNTKIPARAMHILHGNKASFIKRTQRLINDLAYPEKVSDLATFSQQLSQDIESYGQDTRKNSMVIKEFLEDELKAVIRNIHTIEADTATLMKKLNKTPLDRIIQARSLLKEHAQATTTEQQLHTNRQHQKDEVHHLLQEKKQLEEELNEIKDSEQYRQAQQNAQAVSAQRITIKNMMISVSDHFIPFERALRKFSHDSLDQELINSYLADPGTALLDDPDLKILDVLSRLFQKIPDLEPEPKRIAKIQDAIALVNHEVLFQLREQLLTASEELVQLETQNQASTIIHDVEEKQHVLTSLAATIHQRQQELGKEKLHAKASHDELEQLKDVLQEFNATLKA
jgi:hypothetical protein